MIVQANQPHGCRVPRRALAVGIEAADRLHPLAEKLQAIRPVLGDQRKHVQDPAAETKLPPRFDRRHALETVVEQPTLQAQQGDIIPGTQDPLARLQRLPRRHRLKHGLHAARDRQAGSGVRQGQHGMFVSSRVCVGFFVSGCKVRRG